MKLQPDKFDAPTISGHGPGWISVGADRISHSVILSSRGHRADWQCPRFEDLSADHFERLLELAPELVIFGSGTRLRFPQPAWLGALAARRIGVETMDTVAACRTYNILAGEDRHVIAALLMETP
jgi:uncharacterized protein